LKYGHTEKNVFDPDRWGLPIEKIERLPEDLCVHWGYFRECFITHTRDTSEYAFDYMRGILTMERGRHFAGISRSVQGEDGQALQHFMSSSPWAGQSVFSKIQEELCSIPELVHGSYLVLDESADEKAGAESAGTSRQYNGHLGKVDLCQVAVVLGYVNWQSGPWTTWALVDSELFLPEEWFKVEFVQKWKKLGIPKEKSFQTKLELGVAMVRRAKRRGLPFEAVSCDELYGRDLQFRANLEAENVLYAAFVPANQRVYLKKPEIGLPKQSCEHKGRLFSRERILNDAFSVKASEIAASKKTQWQVLQVRHNERGVLENRFAAQRVWTWQSGQPAARQEWLILRIDQSNEHTYALSNAPEHATLPQLASLICSRYFVERVIQDAKDECGWDEFQAQKYLAWEHHVALTACALWFIAKQKLEWGFDSSRDPDLIQHFEIEVLPALSTANVRALLKAVLPLPELSKEEARRQVARHLVNRSRSKASRFRHRAKALAPT
jgi:SRSO17 transposase